MLPRDIDKKVLVKTMDFYDVIKEKNDANREREGDHLLRPVDPLEKIKGNLAFLKDLGREQESDDHCCASTPNTATFRLT